MIQLFKDRDVRIIIRKERDEFDDEEYVAYYHGSDVAKQINYCNTDTINWAKRWNITFYQYQKLLRQNDGVRTHELFIINERKTRRDANYISEQDLKNILIKLKTEEAKQFQQWILRQSTLTKKLFNKIKNIKHQLELQEKNLNHQLVLQEQQAKYQLDLQEQAVKYQNRQQELQKREQILKVLTSEAFQFFPERPSDSGYIYILTSPDKQKRSIYKFGKSINADERLSKLQTGDPDLQLVFKCGTANISIAEKLIHDNLPPIQTGILYY